MCARGRVCVCMGVSIHLYPRAQEQGTLGSPSWWWGVGTGSCRSVNPKGFGRHLSWGTPRAQTDCPLHRSRSRGWPFSGAGLRAASEQGLCIPEPKPTGPPGRAWAAGRGAATSDGLGPYPRPTWGGPGLTRPSGDKPVLLPSRPDGSDPRGPLSRHCLFRGGDTQTPTGHRTGS